MIDLWLKPLHILLVVATSGLFNLRVALRLRQSALIHNKWLKIAPHVVDTLLLLSAVALTWRIHQYPLIDSWLTTKVLGVLLYIGLGFATLSEHIGKGRRIFLWLSTQTVFLSVVFVALTHLALPRW